MKALIATVAVLAGFMAAPIALAGSSFIAENSATQNRVGHSQPTSSPIFITENSASQNQLNAPPATVATPGGFKWTDAGIGASAMFGAMLVLLGGALVLLRRRDHIAIG